MKLQIIILLSTILFFGFTFAEAQTDGNAKNLYFGYKPRAERRQTTTTTTNRTTVETQTSTTTTNSTNQTNSAGRKNTTVGRPNRNTVAGRRNNSTGVSPTPTGLPGTKITIELMRNSKLSFVKPTYKFRSGDKIRLRMKTNFQGYVTVLNLGSTGAVNLLYPVQQRSNYVKPTADFQIPQGEGWIIFDNQPGTEIVSVIMSQYELEGIAGLDRNSDYFSRDRSSKDLFVQTSGNDIYAVFREQAEPGENVGFTLKLKHR